MGNRNDRDNDSWRREQRHGFDTERTGHSGDQRGQQSSAVRGSQSGDYQGDMSSRYESDRGQGSWGHERDPQGSQNQQWGQRDQQWSGRGGSHGNQGWENQGYQGRGYEGGGRNENQGWDSRGYGGDFQGQGRGMGRGYEGGMNRRFEGGRGMDMGFEGQNRSYEGGMNRAFEGIGMNRGYENESRGYEGGGMNRGYEGGGMNRGYEGGMSGQGQYGQQGNRQQGFRGQAPKGYKRSDERIQEDICDRLMHQDNIDITDVEVKVSGGEVTLTGTVPNRQIKHAVENLADAVAGVNDVHNQLRVKRAGAETGEERTSQASQTGQLGQTTSKTGHDTGKAKTGELETQKAQESAKSNDVQRNQARHTSS
jgi:hypothetical protein